jgi:ABC-type sugar transport system ATPase subunit
VAEIHLHEVTKSFTPGVPVLSDLNLHVHQGERLVVLGPSGSGKSTLLRLVAGLEDPDHGEIRIGGLDQAGVPPHRRDLAMVFQNPALYPHLNVFDNIAFGLRARGVPRRDRHKRVQEVGSLLRLQNLLQRRPHELSGGERQRVALGRAVVRRPGVLLLDEPFSNLDEPLRATLRQDLIELHDRFHCTLVHVTHDQGEALGLGQRLAVLERGRLLQTDPPGVVYRRPANRFVASFVGSPGITLVECEIRRQGDELRVQPLGTEPSVLAGPSRDAVSAGGTSDGPWRLDLGVRPEMVSVLDEAVGLQLPSPRPSLRVPAMIQRLEYQGHSILVTLRLGPQVVLARIVPRAELHPGQRVIADLDLSTASWFDPSTGVRLEPDCQPVDNTIA